MTTQSSKVTFETFNDGLCSIRLINDDGDAGTEKECLRYQEKVVGSQRYWEAQTAKVQIDRLIRVPFRPWLTTEYLAVIDGQVYELKQVQTLTDTKPKTNAISLHLTRQRSVADGKV